MVPDRSAVGLFALAHVVEGARHRQRKREVDESSHCSGKRDETPAPLRCPRPQAQECHGCGHEQHGHPPEGALRPDFRLFCLVEQEHRPVRVSLGDGAAVRARHDQHGRLTVEYGMDGHLPEQWAHDVSNEDAAQRFIPVDHSLECGVPGCVLSPQEAIDA
ncbi:hypothetical protein Tfu_1241 [Thermobifida fusca YX]|uniref:Uncharacterized protein n=1 Tax=Thermobifida fusca (strain YX) TaxID=269800 RepID=Q47QJ0_THEFY|nr:hypothetical protein Tfu_1241 [Thermobifida fusca YX]